MAKTTASLRETEAARAYVAQPGFEALAGEVSVSTAHGQASDGARGITGTAFRSLDACASPLAEGVMDRMAEFLEVA